MSTPKIKWEINEAKRVLRRDGPVFAFFIGCMALGNLVGVLIR